jgi:ankyrin repeat protein
MKRSLPERPDLGQLKKQAKELFAAIHAGDKAALGQAGMAENAAANFALHDAQRVVAREYGFPSWAKLKLHVETRTIETAEARLLEAALDGESDAVDAILRERPTLASRTLAIAAVLGEADVIAKEIGRNPNFARTALGPRVWEPLLYVCFGRCGAGDRARADIARQLLAHGANPNASWIHPTWPEAPLAALYGATGVNDYPQLARVLLEAGANPNDGESRYHAAEHNHVASLEVLKAFGTDFSGADRTWGNTPLCFLLGHAHSPATVQAGIRWLLENGANPNVRSYVTGVNEAPLHVAIRNDWELGTITLLLNHGADPDTRRADGRTPYALAVRFGRERTAELLASRGAATDILPIDALLGACLRGDAEAVRAMIRRAPDLATALAASDSNPAEVAAREGRADALTLLAGIGFDVIQPIHEGATPLHWAAWYGRSEAVRALIRLGAKLDVRDNRFDAPPLGWCAHGSLFSRAPGGDYAAVAEALIAAGAEVSPGIEGSAEVMAVLRRHAAK